LIALAFLFVLPTAKETNASTATYSDVGTLGSSGTWADQLIFTEPNVTATFDVTNTSYKAVLGDNTCMATDPCLWWSTDDITGSNCWRTYSYVDTDCDDETSLINSTLAYTPNSVSQTEGVTWTWRTPLCGDVTTLYPTPDNPSLDCPDESTVTINFSSTVSNAIVHLGNIGGNMTFPVDRSSDFTTGFDMTFFSKWTLTSDQEIIQLSGSETSNLMLDGNTIRPTFVPQGLGTRPGVGSCTYNDASCSYRNGTGAGSFLVLGTYSSLTFNIDFQWDLVNYGANNPDPWQPLFDSWLLCCGGFNGPEGVTVQISFYEEGPLTSTTTSSTTTEPESTTTTDAHGPTTTDASELPPTGGSTSGLSLALLVAAIGSLVMVLRRRAA